MELAIIKYLNQFGFDRVNFLTSFLSNELFLILLWTIVTLLFLFFDKKDGRKIFSMVVVALLLHFAISEGLIKNLLVDYFFRLRPYLVDSEIIAIGKPYADSSFPSSHMASTLSVLTVYFYYYKKYWPAMLPFVFLMAFSRMHNGMHYPSDVLAGTLLGIIFGASSIYLLNKIYLLKK
jgi:undecaprenyl-diphosphatase